VHRREFLKLGAVGTTARYIRRCASIGRKARSIAGFLFRGYDRCLADAVSSPRVASPCGRLLREHDIQPSKTVPPDLFLLLDRRIPS
jgi:hypothetical protein